MQMINLHWLSSLFAARQRCIADKKDEWKDHHGENIERMLELLPHGSGLDCGVKFDWEHSKPDKLIFRMDFHHMDDQGSYDGWTTHALTLTPTFSGSGYNMKISGTNRRQIKDYLYQLFSEVFYIDHQMGRADFEKAYLQDK